MDQGREQASNGGLKYGGIMTFRELLDNLHQNAIPESIFDLGIDDYRRFLTERRVLMANKIRDYYQSL